VTSRPRPAPTRPALLGLLLVLSGIVSYFVIALHFGGRLPWVRNTALPNWALIVLGLTLSAVGARQALASPTHRRLAPSLAVVNVTLTAAFAWMLYGMSAVPLVAGPVVGAPAPDFALVDQSGRTARLEDFRGAPLLLVFYRGHW
jgi:4-amino-4-deoxy-L-arabinose transferase-like glycosyltransferase